MTANNEITALLIEDNPGDGRMVREVLQEESSSRFKLELSDRLDTGLEAPREGGHRRHPARPLAAGQPRIDTFLQT